MTLEDKISIVKDILRDKNVAVGFSGGADSTLIAYLSCEVAKDTLAITVDNHLLPRGFIENARKACKGFGIKHVVVDIDFYESEEFLKNSPERCFSCRNTMYSAIENIANERGFDFLCDGNNISDLVADRPGILVTYEKGFNTPFIEAKLTSKDIHEYLDKKAVAYSRSTTCLATRIPTNTPTTREKIERIGLCEDYILDNTECEIVKVRDFGETGIVEVDKIDEILSQDKFKQINDTLKAQGFEKVCLNLSPIDDNEYITIDYAEGSFSYSLPFSIDIESTKNQMENIISYDEEKIKLYNITVHEDGLIEGHDLEDHDKALDCFMDTLQKIRRKI